MNSKIINWDNVLSKSDIFKNNKPFPFGFIENVFEPNFYKMLYETYPKVDSQWYKPTDFTRSATKRGFGNHIASGNGDKFIECQKDKNLSPAWNELFQYLFTDEFIQNMSKYTGIELTKLRHFAFHYNEKGDFNAPHTHHENEDYTYKVTVLAYFAKGWNDGDPGGTYIASEEDESTIVFEPYNLDNSLVCFAETPKSWHGSRYQIHDKPRPSIQFTIF